MDALDQIDQLAKRQAFEELAFAALSKGRALLVMGRTNESAFFASIVMSWKMVPTWSLPTAGVDGVHLLYNPEFIAQFAKRTTNDVAIEDYLKGIIVHEAMHDAFGHHLRRGDRDPTLANIAMDLAINCLIEDAKYKLPKSRLMPGEGLFKDLPRGLSFEEYYTQLPQRVRDLYGSGKNGDPGGCGGALDGHKDEATKTEAEERHKMKVARAHENAAQKGGGQGNLPGWMNRLVHDILEPKVDWKTVLRRFLTAKKKSDYSWTPPNRRFVSQGIYLPGASVEDAGYGIISVDCSGSCWDQATLTRFASEVNGILGAYKVDLTIMYNDTRVVDTKEWSPGQGKLTLEPKGGGGTDHHCVFEWIGQQKRKPDFVVCLTDLYTSVPEQEPEYPVLWCTIVRGMKAPWGRTLEIDLT